MHVDVTAPVITLLGGNPYHLEAGTNFTDPGYFAVDSKDGNVTVNATGAVSGAVAPKSYTRTYRASDASGNIAIIQRLVEVADTLPPVVTLRGEQFVELPVSVTWVDPGAQAIGMLLISQLQCLVFKLCFEGVFSSPLV
jgi:hypothetical protein